MSMRSELVDIQENDGYGMHWDERNLDALPEDGAAATSAAAAAIAAADSPEVVDGTVADSLEADGEAAVAAAALATPAVDAKAAVAAAALATPVESKAVVATPVESEEVVDAAAALAMPVESKAVVDAAAALATPVVDISEADSPWVDGTEADSFAEMAEVAGVALSPPATPVAGSKAVVTPSSSPATPVVDSKAVVTPSSSPVMPVVDSKAVVTPSSSPATPVADCKAVVTPSSAPATPVVDSKAEVAAPVPLTPRGLPFSQNATPSVTPLKATLLEASRCLSPTHPTEAHATAELQLQRGLPAALPVATAAAGSDTATLQPQTSAEPGDHVVAERSAADVVMADSAAASIDNTGTVEAQV